MSASRDQIDALLRHELARPEAAYARAQLASLLVEPRPTKLTWRHTPAGPFDAWIVGSTGDGRMQVVWCDEGLGAGSYPWGVVIAGDGDQGIDTQWHLRLLDAAIFIGVVPAPPGYEVP